MIKEYDFEYCHVKYIEEEKVVLLTWKKFASFDNYRTPTTFALELLRQTPDCNFIVDARNGFEDEKADVDWGREYLLPNMAKTQCKTVAFILNQVNEIEEEMDMWTVEFGKYFAVVKAESYDQVLEKMHHMLMVQVRYTIGNQKRDEFLQCVKKYGIMQASKEEPGNYKYDYYLPDNSQEDLCLLEIWTNDQAQKNHGTTKHYEKLQELKQKYVSKVEIKKYQIDEIN